LPAKLCLITFASNYKSEDIFPGTTEVNLCPRLYLSLQIQITFFSRNFGDEMTKIKQHFSRTKDKDLINTQRYHDSADGILNVVAGPSCSKKPRKKSNLKVSYSAYDWQYRVCHE
jgi:hypothetical protein